MNCRSRNGAVDDLALAERCRCLALRDTVRELRRPVTAKSVYDNGWAKRDRENEGQRRRRKVQ